MTPSDMSGVFLSTLIHSSYLVCFSFFYRFRSLGGSVESISNGLLSAKQVLTVSAVMAVPQVAYTVSLSLSLLPHLYSLKFLRVRTT